MTSSEMNEMSSHVSPAESVPREAMHAHGISQPANAARALKRSPYPRLVGKLLRRAAAVQVAEWDRALRFVEQSQMRTLLELLDHASGSYFGRVHGFRGIRSY